MDTRDPVVQEVRRTVLRDVLRWALPTTGFMAAVALALAVPTGILAAQPARGAASFVLLVFSVVSALAAWRGRFEQAVGWLISGVLATTALALTFNGGLRSPSRMLLLFLIALCGWVFGRRGATVMALLAAGLASLFLVLGVSHALPEPPPLPLVGEFVMMVVVISLTWSTSARPPERMREALLKAAERERDLKAEQAQRLAVATQFQAVFDQTAHFVGLVSPDGILRRANRTALEFIGLTSAESVLGRPFVETPWWTRAQQPLLAEHLASAASGKVVRFETTHVDVGGRARIVDFSLSPFRDETGALRYLIAEGRDITDVVQQKERTHAAQRLELVGQLAGGVAHDFNNVLMVMLSSAEVLQGDLEAAGVRRPEVTESINAIIEAGHRASDLTRRLLSFARRGSVARRPLSVHALIESTCRLLQRTLPANVRVVCELRAHEERVEGDIAALESVLINLAVNARDAMPAGGTLTFSTERVELDAAWCRLNAVDLAPGSYVRLSVRDTGTGIAPAHLKHVFEPFFTTKEEGKGTGLGLASVYGVVREHGGTVQVESRVGEGAHFHLLLPLSAQPVATVAAPSSSTRFHGVRALVVDDEPGLRTMVPKLLGTLGIECVTASSAEEATRRFDDTFQLLVSDIALPGRRGSDLAAELLARDPRLAVVLMTGFPKESDIAGLPAERVRLLLKPFSLADLQMNLGALLKSSVELAAP